MLGGVYIGDACTVRIAATTLVALLAVFPGLACGNAPHVPPEGLPLLFEAVGEEPALYESAMDGCVEIHNVWKAQVRAVHLTAGGSISNRMEMLRDSAYAPYAEFWDGYASDFVGWARRELDLASHPQRAFPTQVDLPSLIADVTAQAEEMTGFRGCAQWYLVYGPGWAGMGALTDGRMLVEFFAHHSSPEDMRWALPHEVAHVIRGLESEPKPWDLLAVIVTEGVADYFKDTYWGNDQSVPETLGYSRAEWDWAIAHESELWDLAMEQLGDTSPAVIHRYQAADKRVHPDGPTHVGYFLGYRIAEAYIARHGEDALVDLFRLSARKILEESGYSPG
ncbi:MAG: DUF2268 domain-containing putative Zn-dependent protease [Gemmatimonadota bacterium]|nr:DUF2268 domain-containing putative Zn-dependent protease [Gemmatimonadota bacterium]